MTDQTSVPGVLLIAKKDAEQQALEESCVAGGGKPWDQGHWANRQ